MGQVVNLSRKFKNTNFTVNSERTSAVVNHRINVGETTAVVKSKLSRLAKGIAEKYNLTLHAFTPEKETPSSITLTSSTNELEPAPITPTAISSLTPYAVLS